jgi:hypothetical protein
MTPLNRSSGLTLRTGYRAEADRSSTDRNQEERVVALAGGVIGQGHATSAGLPGSKISLVTDRLSPAEELDIQSCLDPDSAWIGDGFLKQIVEATGIQDIGSIVDIIMEETTQFDRKLLIEVLRSVQRGVPIDLSKRDIEDIRKIFEILDYLGLDQLQEEIEKTLPSMSLKDMPPTIFSLTAKPAALTKSQQWTRGSIYLNKFFALKHLRLIGAPISQHRLDQLPLPATLRSLQLPAGSRITLNRKEQALVAVRADGRALAFASAKLQADPDVVCAAVVQDAYALNYTLKTKELVLLAVSVQGEALEHAPAALQDDQEVVFAAVSQNGRALRHASSRLRDNRKVLMAGISQSEWALLYASNRLKGDREVVGAAVRKEGQALGFASDELQADRELVLTAVRQNAAALTFASTSLKGDKPLLLEAVRQDGKLLNWACDALRADRELVLTAVGQNGMALQWASTVLQADPDVVLAAVHQNGTALTYASSELRSNRSLVLEALRTSPLPLLCTPSQELLNDPELLILAVGQHGKALNLAGPAPRDNAEVVLVAVSQDGNALQYASERLRGEPEVVLAAVSQDGNALQYAHPRLQSNPAVVRAARDAIQHPITQRPRGCLNWMFP